MRVTSVSATFDTSVLNSGCSWRCRFARSLSACPSRGVVLHLPAPPDIAACQPHLERHLCGGAAGTLRCWRSLGLPRLSVNWSLRRLASHSPVVSSVRRPATTSRCSPSTVLRSSSSILARHTAVCPCARMPLRSVLHLGGLVIAPTSFSHGSNCRLLHASRTVPGPDGHAAGTLRVGPPV